MQISQRVFSLLDSTGQSQKKLADYLKISQQAISNWKERGTDPPAKLIYTIADFFNVSVEWLLTGESPHKGTVHVSGSVSNGSVVQGVNNGNFVVHNGQERGLSDEAAELLRIYESLDVKKRMNLLKVAFELEEEKNNQ